MLTPPRKPYWFVIGLTAVVIAVLATMRWPLR